MILKKQTIYVPIIFSLALICFSWSLFASKQAKEIEGIEYIGIDSLQLIKAEIRLEVSVFKRRRLLSACFPPSYEDDEIKKEVEELQPANITVKYFRAVSRLIEDRKFKAFPDEKYSLFFIRVKKKANGENGLMFCGSTLKSANDRCKPVCAVRYSSKSGTLKFIDAQSWMDFKKNKEKQGARGVPKK